MLTLLTGTDWISNRDVLLNMIAEDVASEKGGRILMVPELISHDTERRLAAVAGDTCSRFADVLSFSRLAKRVSETVGRGMQDCLDNGGRVVAMAAAARLLHSKLKAYASVESRPEFLTGLVEAVDEFKRCCISAEDLHRASQRTEGSFAQKLEELALLLDTYDSLCARGKRDPRDQMTWLLEQMEDCSFAEDHVFYIDGFPDFTRQHMAIIAHLIRHSAQVVISVNCDRPGSKKLAFEKAGSTAAELMKIARDACVQVEIRQIAPRQDALGYVRDHLFQGAVHRQTLDCMQLYRAESVHSECLAAAERIMTLVRGGARYRDISVVCADMPTYRNALSMVLQRCKIPMYQSGTEDILEKSVINTVLTAVEAALGGFEQRDVIRYLKSMLSPIEPEICDRIENYAIAWNITGSRWHNDWTNHPGGLGEVWTEEAQNELNYFNEIRKESLDPLIRLHKGFRDAVNVKQQVETVYSFLEEIRLAQRLSRMAEQMDEAGDNRNAQILNQLWDILLSALEQMHDVLGQTVWDGESFTRLLRLLLSQYDVGTIPPVLDAVMAGPVSAMRCQQEKHLIVLGALEGNLPGYAGSSGVLTDLERTELRQMGVPLTGGAMEGLQAEFAEIYGVFCGAEESVAVLCPGGQPSFVFRRLLDMAGGETFIDTRLSAAGADTTEAGAFLARFNGQSAAQTLGIEETYNDILRRKNHALGVIGPEHVKALYGTQLNLSASQVDRQAECRLSYFLKYGMKAKERKTITVDPAEFGTYVHAVLEQTAKRVMDLGGFKKVSLDETLRFASEYSEAYALERFSQLDSRRLAYLFRRNVQELEMVVEELWQEMQECAFEPIAFELAFGKGGQMGAIQVPAQKMRAQLLGVVDRVDSWQEEGQNFFRVVDYKTGRKDFDYCDVFNGVGLQMLLYLFALEDEGADVVGDRAVPVGVQYFPARAPLISADGQLSEEELAASREKVWKRKGLILSEEEVLSAMEPAEKPVRLSYTRKKDGSISGDLADRQQFRLLKAYVFSLLGKLVDDIASGCVEPNPYTRGTSHSACAFCPYGAVCHPESVEGRRDYKTMTSQRFWEEIEKEMKKHG